MKSTIEEPGGKEHKQPAAVVQQINNGKWCFSFYAGKEHAEFNERAALLNSARWKAGDIITISFLDGDPEVQEKVKKVAKAWIAPGLANLVFQFRKDTTDTHIRITFKYAGSWSVLGTTCKKVAKDKPTMNFGWLYKDTPEEDLRRVVLHEFGHALGLIHEHMNPKEGGVKWNVKKVEEDLQGPPNNWTKETIYNNMFKTFEEEELSLTNLDRESVMMYPIPANWTTDGFSVGMNQDLSPTDKKFIRACYPGNA